jgi:predicted Zn-dependent peptidase
LTRATLSNGLRVVISPRPRTALTALKLFMKVGSRHDVDRPGISHFVEHLMLHRPSRMQPVAEEIEALGGEINAVTHREYTALQAVVLPQQASQVLRMFRTLLEPLEMAADRVERERDVIVQEIEQATDTNSAAWDLFLQALWGDDPFTRPICGDPAVIREVTPVDLTRHFSRYATPERMVLAVAGPVVLEDVIGSAEHALGDLAGPGWQDAFSTRRTGLRRRRLVKDTRVAHLIVGVEAVPLADPRRSAVKVMDMVLGQGATSRLYRGLRSRWGLVYEVATAAMAFEDRGYLCAYTSCAPANAARVIEVLLEELERLAREPIGEAELERARMRYEGMLARRFETVLAAAGITGIEELLACSEPFEEAIARVRQVDVDEVLRIAADLVDLDRIAVALVGPAGTLGV